MLGQPTTGWRTGNYLPLAVTAALSLAVLAGTVFVAALYVRHKGRDQITGQTARILYELWLSQKASEPADTLGSGTERVSDELRSLYETRSLPHTALAGLWGTRLFKTNGAFEWADPTVSESTLSSAEVKLLQHLKPFATLHDDADLSEVNANLISATPPRGPLLEVCIPLHTPGQNRLVGIAQFLLDGSSVAAEFEALDRTLIVQATATYLAGGGLLVTVLWMGFERLQRANRLLRERTESLLQANQELTMAAKTSAVGAVTAHLIHGLRNPLSGLQNLVSSRPGPGNEMTESDWQLAASSTRRMQALVGEIVRVLRDEQSEIAYELSLEEFAGVLNTRMRPLAQEAQVAFELRVEGEAVLQNREANVISLVLYNLVQNAIQATPQDKRVALSLTVRSGTVVCQVRDSGPGFAPGQQAQLFKPCASTKEGGSGIGLAISKQLTNSIGAELELKRTGSDGSIFELVFDPAKRSSEGKGVEQTAV